MAATALSFATIGAVVAVLLLSGSSDPESALVAPAPSSTTTTTTTSVPIQPANETVVATATGPMLTVAEKLPASFEANPAITAAANQYQQNFAPLSPERADAVEIPSISEPVVGRRRTETGWEFDSPTPFDNPLVLVVVEDQGEWLKVQLPVRPNGAVGWIESSEVTVSRHRYRVEVDISDRMVRLFNDVVIEAESPVVVGAEGSTTPTGRFYITDFDERNPQGSYGPWVLALSAFSQDLDSFSGGAPLIALHGTNAPARLGTAASNGCVRLPNDVIMQLRDTVPLGTPVDIRP